MRDILERERLQRERIRSDSDSAEVLQFINREEALIEKVGKALTYEEFSDLYLTANFLIRDIKNYIEHKRQSNEAVNNIQTDIQIMTVKRIEERILGIRNSIQMALDAIKMSQSMSDRADKIEAILNISGNEYD